MRKIRAAYPRIVLRPFDYLRIAKTKAGATWADSLNKFHAFDLRDYARVLVFDADTQVLNNMDDFFAAAPRAPVAAPRAYWLNNNNKNNNNINEEEGAPAVAEQVLLSSHVMLLEPNGTLYRQLVDEALSSGKLDMDLVNLRFRDSAAILPHRRLALLTGEFRGKDHRRYIAPAPDGDEEEWDAVAEISRAYLVHFSDWPLPKPWKSRTKDQWEAALPECDEDEAERPDRPRCADRLVWTGFYEEYGRDWKRYCKRLG